MDGWIDGWMGDEAAKRMKEAAAFSEESSTLDRHHQPRSTMMMMMARHRTLELESIMWLNPIQSNPIQSIEKCGYLVG